MKQRPRISLVVTDLDNTIYDWLAAFVPAFYAMVAVAAPLIGVSEEALLDDLKRVHQQHGDSEHPFALLETSSVREKWGALNQTELIERLDPAFHAFNRLRKKSLKLYPGVLETLERLSQIPVPIVAYTDARVINSLFRLDHLNVRRFFSRLYAPAHVAPDLGEAATMDFVRLLSTYDRKPNPQTLIDICSEYSVAPSRAIYVGDSIVRDVYMANSAGVHSAWAKFGTLYDKSLWPQLVRVTHWTDADVARESELWHKAQGANAEIALDQFSDLLNYCDFEPVMMTPAISQLR